jgi:hypothetical protein
MAAVLDERLLDRFEAALRAVSAPVLRHLAPGLTDAQIDAQLAPLGIDLPEEARVWWRWRDGWLPGSPPAENHLVPDRVKRPVARAAHLFADIAPYLPEWGMEWQGDLKLLSFVSEKPRMYIACAGPRDAPVPVWTQNDIEDPEQRLPSIGALIERWCWLLEERIWDTAEDGAWRVAAERIPHEWVVMHIV